MDIILYSTGCPRCKVLKKKLSEKDISYSEINDVDVMLKLGITEVPVLSVNDTLMDYVAAVNFLNGVEGVTNVNRGVV